LVLFSIYGFIGNSRNTVLEKVDFIEGILRLLAEVLQKNKKGNKPGDLTTGFVAYEF
jgi:hypothetical protein